MSQVIGELENLINQGRYLEARSRAEDALANNQNPSRVKQLLSLAMSKAGMAELALETITPLYQQFPEDTESAGILGSIYKELFKKNQKTSFAIQSRDTYFKNFQATQSFYTGINAASMSAMAGQGSKGREIATQVISIVEKLSAGFWELATLGEAYLLTKNKARSIESYVSARKLAGNDWGKVTSVHNQLWLLNHYLAVPNEVMKLFAPPNVIAFSGHMIDQPGRTIPRFPAEIESKMKESIRNSIRTLNARIGYSSLACGSDILFVEAMIEEGGEVNLLLPFDVEDFIKTSLAFAGEQWVDRFKKIISTHPVQLSTHGHYGNNDELFAFLSRAIYGQAVLRSNYTHSQPYLLTVSSETDLKRKTGGTKDTVGRWPFPQRHLNINPDIFSSSLTISPSAPFEPYKFQNSLERLAYMIYLGFDDGLEILTDKINSYKENINDEMRRISAAQSINGAIVLAFESESATLEFISHLQESLIPLRTSHSFKVALHAGLVLMPTPNQIEGFAFDKLVKIGNQIASGSIYASELFASLLALNTRNYILQYAGVLLVDQNNPQPFYMVDELK